MKKMDSYKYLLSSKVHTNIYDFYTNVSKKYKNTYSFELMKKNIIDAYNSIYQIENGLSRRQPTIPRWAGKGHMANTKKWYFLYRIDGDTIYVEDACHAQNMHEEVREPISAEYFSKLFTKFYISEYRPLNEHNCTTHTMSDSDIRFVIKNAINTWCDQNGIKN